MSATHPEDPVPASLYLREQLARIDLTQERYLRLRTESEPRIKAMIAKAERDNAETQKVFADLASMTKQNSRRITWVALTAGLAGIGTLLIGVAAILKLFNLPF